MAICTLSNLIGNENTKAAIFSHSLDGRLLDCAISFLAHERVELRQISATLVYNFTLVCTSSKYGIGRWCPPGTATVTAIEGSQLEATLPESAVQILCSVIGELTAEIDSATRRRRLSCALRIIRNCKVPAVALINDLGFSVYFHEMKLMTGISVEEAAIVHEVIQAIETS